MILADAAQSIYTNGITWKDDGFAVHGSRSIELKQNYLEQLADEGSYAEVLDVDYNEPSYCDLANADEIVPDDVIFYEYEGVSFVPDDFFCTVGAWLFGGSD